MTPMLDWLTQHGATLVLVMFFIALVGFALWAYAPRNKQKLEDHAQIPLRETEKND